jgi:TRAP-type C4-dicarboxylate transport system substrate-binding protein
MTNFSKLVLGGLAAIMAMGLAHAPAQAAQYSYGSFSPPSAAVPTLAYRAFANEVAKKTGGKITFKLFAGGSLVGPRNTLSGIRDGIVDSGFVIPAFDPTNLPHVNMVPDMTAFGTSAVQIAGAATETILLDCPECLKDYAKMDAVTLGGTGSAPFALLCAKEIHSLADLKGMKIRVAAAAHGRWVRSVGAVPVGSMPPPEIVTGMQQGQVDCAVAVPEWLIGFSLADAVKQVVYMPLGDYEGLSSITLSKKIWEGLSAKDKHIFLRASANAIASATIEDAYIKSPKEVDEAIKKHGIKVMQATPEMKAAWKHFLSGEMDAAIKGAEARRVAPAVAKRVITKHRTLLKKWKKIAEDVGTDKKKFAQALWNEIYSKVKF